MTRRERLQVDLPPEPMDELRALAEVSGCDLTTTVVHMIRAEVRALYLDEAPPELAWRFERAKSLRTEERIKRNGAMAPARRAMADRNAEIRRLRRLGWSAEARARHFHLSLRRIREVDGGDGV